MVGREPRRGASPVALVGLVLLLALALSASRFEAAIDRRIPGGWVLIQKGGFQALYDEHGRIERLLQDRNHDGRAEVVILYYPNGKPRLGEIDSDGDGVVDRREYFRTDGTLERAWTLPGSP